MKHFSEKFPSVTNRQVTLGFYTYDTSLPNVASHVSTEFGSEKLYMTSTIDNVYVRMENGFFSRKKNLISCKRTPSAHTSSGDVMSRSRG